MKPLLKRNKVQVLCQVGHTQQDVAKYTDVGLKTVQRNTSEASVNDLDDRTERKKRRLTVPVKPNRSG